MNDESLQIKHMSLHTRNINFPQSGWAVAELNVKFPVNQMNQSSIITPSPSSTPRTIWTNDAHWPRNIGPKIGQFNILPKWICRPILTPSHREKGSMPLNITNKWQRAIDRAWAAHHPSSPWNLELVLKVSCHTQDGFTLLHPRLSAARFCAGPLFICRSFIVNKRNCARGWVYGMAVVDISGDDAVHALEITSIGLTMINALSSASVVLLVLFDNIRHRQSWWKLSWERRVPFYLGLSVLLSHIIFATREFLEFNSVNATAESTTNGCIAANEGSWWGVFLSFPKITLAIWFPLVAVSIRILLMATSILLKVIIRHFLYLTISTMHSRPHTNVCTYFLSVRYRSLFGFLHTFSILLHVVHSSCYSCHNQTLLSESQQWLFSASFF